MSEITKTANIYLLVSIVVISYCALVQCTPRAKYSSTEISRDHRKILENLDSDNEWLAKLKNVLQNDSENQQPLLVGMPSTYVSVDDIDAFLLDYTLWEKEKALVAMVTEVETRMKLLARNWRKRGLDLSGAEYIDRFDWLTDCSMSGKSAPVWEDRQSPLATASTHTVLEDHLARVGMP